MARDSPPAWKITGEKLILHYKCLSNPSRYTWDAIFLDRSYQVKLGIMVLRHLTVIIYDLLLYTFRPYLRFSLYLDHISPVLGDKTIKTQDEY